MIAWNFPNSFVVTTRNTVVAGLTTVREYVVISPFSRKVVGVYPSTDIGWCDAVVHAARGEAL